MPSVARYLSGLRAALLLCAASPGQAQTRASYSGEEIAYFLRAVQSVRLIALQDTSPIDVCDIDMFWTASGNIVSGINSLPAIAVTNRRDCAARRSTGDAVRLEAATWEADSVVLGGTTVRGLTQRVEWYVLVRDAMVWRFREYRISQFLALDPADPSLPTIDTLHVDGESVVPTDPSALEAALHVIPSREYGLRSSSVSRYRPRWAAATRPSPP